MSPYVWGIGFWENVLRIQRERPGSVPAEENLKDHPSSPRSQRSRHSRDDTSVKNPQARSRGHRAHLADASQD